MAGLICSDVRDCGRIENATSWFRTGKQRPCLVKRRAVKRAIAIAIETADCSATGLVLACRVVRMGVVGCEREPLGRFTSVIQTELGGTVERQDTGLAVHFEGLKGV